jgi:hypothetical protein
MTFEARRRAAGVSYRSGVGRLWKLRAVAVTAVVVLATAGCGSSNTTAADVTPDPQTVSAIDGRFEVRFTVNRTTLKPGDNISGTAELWLKAGGSGVISGSSSLFSFEFVEVGGLQRSIAPVLPGDCSPHQLGATTPLTSGIVKSGAMDGIGANADFRKQFLQGETINLPAGTWDITAVAGFFEGRSCQGLPHSVRSTVRVTVDG